MQLVVFESHREVPSAHSSMSAEENKVFNKLEEKDFTRHERSLVVNLVAMLQSFKAEMRENDRNCDVSLLKYTKKGIAPRYIF